MASETDTLDLTISVEEPRGWARRLTITVPADRVERARAEVLKRIRGRVKLPGFRQGRVPDSVIQRQFGATIQHETVERVVDAAYRQALQEKGFHPISQAEVEEIDYQPGSDLRFQVQFEVRPEITLDRLGGFKVARERARVGDEEVDQVIERLRTENANWQPLESGTPGDGDRVTVRITPLREGAEPKPREYEIVLGEGQAIPDVEDAIRTLEPGASGEFEIAIPAQEEESAEPEQQRIRVELVAAQRAELPSLDDEFARSLGEQFPSLAELRDRIRQDLEREADAEAERDLRRKLIDQVVEANPFDVPRAMVQQYLEQVLPAREGMPADRLAEMHEMARPGAERAIRRMLIVEKIAEQQDLKPSAEQVDARVEEIAERSGRPVGEVWTQLQRSGRLDRIEEEIVENRVFEFLKSKSDIQG